MKYRIETQQVFGSVGSGLAYDVNAEWLAHDTKPRGLAAAKVALQAQHDKSGFKPPVRVVAIDASGNSVEVCRIESPHRPDESSDEVAVLIGNITIEHNHGVIVLRDAVWFEGGELTGTVVSGGYTSRLGQHSSHRPLEVGSKHHHSVGELDRIRQRGGDMAYVSVVYC